jgi:hypothetical protein
VVDPLLQFLSGDHCIRNIIVRKKHRAAYVNRWVARLKQQVGRSLRKYHDLV